MDALTPSPLATVWDRYKPAMAEPEPRRRGRPTKRTADYLQALLAEHAQTLAWYAGLHGEPARSDRELYTAFFGHQMELQGMRAGKAATATFQGCLKTLRNELALARAMTRTVPANAVFSGRDAGCNEGVQRHPLTPEEVHRGS